MNLRVTILNDKVRVDGSHKLRIGISHNGKTRYIVTRFVIPSEKNLKNGNVVNLPNATYINQQLRTLQSKIYTIYDALEDRDAYTCAQLLKVIKHKMNRGTIRTVEEINFEMIKIKENMWSLGSLRLHNDGISRFIEYVGKDFILSMLDSATVFGFKKHLLSKGLSETTVGMRIAVVRKLVFFATTHGYAKYEIPPFFDYRDPKPIVRDVAVDLDTIRAIRDMEISDKWTECARDLFMLSFYLCGMNLCDILVQDFRKESVRFIRTKTKSRRNPNEQTEFTIQPEARAIIDKYIMPDGHLAFYGREKHNSVRRITTDYLKNIREQLNLDTLIFYSARKSFAQLANELMIKDSIIEYCIGDAPSNPRKALNFYIKINKRIADNAIRKVLDAVASDEPLENLVSKEF